MEPGELRAGDADRERVADRLRSALNEGRLSLDEYDERLREAYAAKTYNELDGLVKDLPDTVPVERSQVVPVTDRARVAEPDYRAEAPPNAVRDWLLDAWTPWLYANGICLAVWGGTSLLAMDVLPFWPIFVAVPWGLVLVIVTVVGMSTGEPYKWAVKKERKRVERAKRKARED